MSRRPLNETRRQSGMTRLDFVIGIGVLSLLISIAGIPGRAGDARLLEIADSRIRSAMDLASARARSSKTPHGVVFDVESNRIAVIDATGTLATDPLNQRESIIDLDHGKLATYVDLVSARFGRGGTLCIFDGNGIPMSAGQVRLAAGRHRRVLIVDAATGWVETTIEVLEDD
jgi:hypothetical protein